MERRGDDITGMAVALASRICDSGGAGDVVVSRTVTDLVIGSELAFIERGAPALKGVPGEWSLFMVAPEGSAALS